MLDVLERVTPTSPRHADEPPDFDWRAVAGQEFRRRIDERLRQRYAGRVLPWERSVAVGEIDYWRVHAFALDRYGELLSRVLPLGDFSDCYTTWRGRHDERGNWITVSLLSGAWSDPTARKYGSDLVGLIAHIYRLTSRRAAIRLGQWLGIEAVRHG